MAFARHQFALSEPQDDGSPLLAHLQSVWRATGVQPDMLAEAPPLPSGLESLWREFCDLHGSRGTAGFGAARITWTDIDAYQRVNRLTFSAWEIGCIRKCDDLWLAEFAPKPKAAA